MKVRMIFATPVDRQDWLVGQVYDAPANVAESLIRSGRAEPVVARSEPEPEQVEEQVEVQEPAAPTRKRRRSR